MNGPSLLKRWVAVALGFSAVVAFARCDNTSFDTSQTGCVTGDPNCPEPAPPAPQSTVIAAQPQTTIGSAVLVVPPRGTLAPTRLADPRVAPILPYDPNAMTALPPGALAGTPAQALTGAELQKIAPRGTQVPAITANPLVAPRFTYDVNAMAALPPGATLPTQGQALTGAELQKIAPTGTTAPNVIVDPRVAPLLPYDLNAMAALPPGATIGSVRELTSSTDDLSEAENGSGLVAVDPGEEPLLPYDPDAMAGPPPGDVAEGERALTGNVEQLAPRGTSAPTATVDPRVTPVLTFDLNAMAAPPTVTTNTRIPTGAPTTPSGGSFATMCKFDSDCTAQERCVQGRCAPTY